MCYGFLLVHKPPGLVSILTEIALVLARALLPHCMLQEGRYCGEGGVVLIVYSKAVQCWPELGSVSLCRMNAGVGVQVLRDSIFSDGYLISKSIV